MTKQNPSEALPLPMKHFHQIQLITDQSGKDAANTAPPALTPSLGEARQPEEREDGPESDMMVDVVPPSCDDVHQTTVTERAMDKHQAGHNVLESHVVKDEEANASGNQTEEATVPGNC